MVVSFEDIISESAFDIMKLVYRDFKPANVSVCNRHYHNIHDPDKLVRAINSSILLLLGLLIILETLLKNLRKGTQSSVKLQDWHLQP